MSAETHPTDPLLGARDWERLRLWYDLHGRHDLPWRKDRSPWRVLIAETLLHRTRADSVAALYPAVVREFTSPEAVAGRPDRWREMTRPAGLAWRAGTFVRGCAELLRSHGNRVPAETDALLALPGVGHYVAAAVRCFGFGERAVLVDTNTIRLAGRISGTDLDPARHRTRAVRETVARLGPGGGPPDAEDNFALLDLAALVCTPRAPRCKVCPLAEGCVTGRSVTGMAEGDQGENGP